MNDAAHLDQSTDQPDQPAGFSGRDLAAELAAQPSPELPPAPATEERVTSPQTIGTIIHESYGISINGEPAAPKTLEELQAEGYSPKEISNALKAGLIMDTMAALADTMDGTSFLPTETTWLGNAGEKHYTFSQPSDLLTPEGQTDFAKLKLYLNAQIDQTAQAVWLGSYREAHPTAFDTLYRLTKPFGPDTKPADMRPLEALDIGLSAIIATHHFIADTNPTAPLGPSLQQSLPALYRLASQNFDNAPPNLLEGAGFTHATEQTQERQLHDQLRSHLEALEPAQLHQVKDMMLDDLLTRQTRGDTDEDLVETINRLDLAFDDQATFLNYLTRQQLPDVAPTAAAKAYFEREEAGSNLTADLFSWFKWADIPMSEELSDTLIDLELVQSTSTLNPDYFTAEQDEHTGVVKVSLIAAPPEPGRSTAALLRTEVMVDDAETGHLVAQPADLIIPKDKTTRCSAMYSTIPAEPGSPTAQACHTVGFRSGRLNGIAYFALMDAVATHQAHHANQP